MVKIWAKVMKREKIKAEYMLINDNNYYEEDFYEYLMQICKQLDVETPIILSKHTNHFEEFNNTKFMAEDFIDEINFDYLVLENVAE